MENKKRERGWSGLNGAQHPRSRPIVGANEKGEEFYFQSINQCAVLLDMAQPNISNCLNKLNKKCYSKNKKQWYTFKYWVEPINELSAWQRRKLNEWKGLYK
jgi:hypothetical protein